MPNNQIDDLFKEKLSNFEASPGENSWGKILAQLSVTPNSIWATQYLRFIYGSLALLFVALPISYLIFSNKPAKSIAKSNKTETVQENKNNIRLLTNNHSLKQEVQNIEPNSSILSVQEIKKVEEETHKTLHSNKQNLKKREKNTSKKRISTRQSDSYVGTNIYSSNKQKRDKNQQHAMLKTPMLNNEDPLPNPWFEKSKLPYGIETTSTELEYYLIPLKATSSFMAKNDNTLKEEAAREDEISQSFYKLKGLHVGATFAYNTVWILNQNTYGQFGKYELAYMPKGGYYYGGVLGYDIGNRFGVQLEYHYRSNQGQDYQDKVKRKIYTRKIDMQYQNIPLLFKLKIPKISGEFDRPASFNILIGVQYSKLYSARQLLNGQETTITERFKKHDISGVLGAEYNAYLSERLFFSIGVRATFSITDINDASWQNTIDPKSSRNSIVGANVGLHYKVFR